MNGSDSMNIKNKILSRYRLLKKSSRKIADTLLNQDEQGNEIDHSSAVAPVEIANTTVKATDTDFVAAASGKLEHLEDVHDDVFSKKMVGDGYAVEPTDGKIVAPAAGTIVSVMKNTKHAITMKTDAGLEVLIHMGLDTVELEGKPFDVKVSDGEKVSAGQELAVMNLEDIKTAGKDTTIIVTVTNAAHVAGMTSFDDQAIKAGQKVMTVTSK